MEALSGHHPPTQGDTSADIARALGCSQRSVQVWVNLSNAQGHEALKERPHTGRPPRLAGTGRDRFRRRVEAGFAPEERRATFHGLDHQRILRDEFGVTLSLQAVYDLRHRMGSSSLMPRPQHMDADEELRAIFREVVPDQVQVIREAHLDEEIRIYLEDEARFGPQGTMARVWARTGSRPRAVRQTRYGNLYLLTAVCAATDDACGLISPTLVLL